MLTANCYIKAIEYYQQRIALARVMQDHRVEQQALSSLKVACYAVGDYTKAMEYE